jgi:hypothetical protein
LPNERKEGRKEGREGGNDAKFLQPGDWELETPITLLIWHKNETLPVTTTLLPGFVLEWLSENLVLSQGLLGHPWAAAPRHSLKGRYSHAKAYSGNLGPAHPTASVRAFQGPPR